MMAAARPGACVAVALAALATACERERRLFDPPPGVTAPAASQPPRVQAVEHPYERNAYAVSQGKRLYRWFNCNGCHAQGGGGMGPALMDGDWRYGHAPAAIHASIVDGRPQGMPAFGGRITDEQAWQLVAYVRSLSGQLRKDAAPGRSDSLMAGEAELARDREPARTASPAPVATARPLAPRALGPTAEEASAPAPGASR
jgi:cytochrome c oxidase cbb3-type subunit 3